MTFEPFDQELTERAQREDCPIPEGFDARVTQLLEQLPERPRRQNRGRRRIVVLLAAALLLTACTAGATTLVLHQARHLYFDSAAQAGEATAQAALEADASTAAIGSFSAQEIEDYPPQESWNLEDIMAHMEQVYAHAYGGPEDGWTEMCAGGYSPTDRTYYKADTLAGLSEFWPVDTPDLVWLDQTYLPLPGGQCFLDWRSEFMPTASSLNFWGEYQSQDGAPVSFNWTFYLKHLVTDTFTVLSDQVQVEEYTTTDGCIVTIEWVTADSGQLQFNAYFGYGYADFQVSGADLEPTEVYQILDHMNLSALCSYQP